MADKPTATLQDMIAWGKTNATVRLRVLTVDRFPNNMSPAERAAWADDVFRTAGLLQLDEDKMSSLAFLRNSFCWKGDEEEGFWQHHGRPDWYKGE